MKSSDKAKWILAHIEKEGRERKQAYGSAVEAHRQAEFNSQYWEDNQRAGDDNFGVGFGNPNPHSSDVLRKGKIAKALGEELEELNGIYEFAMDQFLSYIDKSDATQGGRADG